MSDFEKHEKHERRQDYLDTNQNRWGQRHQYYASGKARVPFRFWVPDAGPTREPRPRNIRAPRVGGISAQASLSDETCWGEDILTFDGDSSISGVPVDFNPIFKLSRKPSKKTGQKYWQVTFCVSFGYNLDPDLTDLEIVTLYANGRKFYDVGQGGLVGGKANRKLSINFHDGNQTAPHPALVTAHGTRAVMYQRQVTVCLKMFPLEFFPAGFKDLHITGRFRSASAVGRRSVADQIELLARRTTRYTADDVVFEGMSGIVNDGVRLPVVDFRSLISSYARVYGLDWLESGGKLKFQRRSAVGEAVDLTLTSQQCLASGQPGTLRRALGDDDELPDTFELTYIDYTQAFRELPQRARLPPFPAQVGGSGRDDFLSVPFVMRANEALTGAHQSLYRDRIGKNAITFSLPWTCLDLEPGDRVAIDTGEREYLVKLSAVSIQGDLSLNCEGVEMFFADQGEGEYTLDGYSGEPIVEAEYGADVADMLATLAATLPGYSAAMAATVEVSQSIALAATLPGYTAAMAAAVSAAPVSAALAATLPGYTAAMAVSVASTGGGSLTVDASGYTTDSAAITVDMTNAPGGGGEALTADAADVTADNSTGTADAAP